METFDRIIYSDDQYICEKCGGEYEYLSLGEYRCKRCGNTDKDDYGKVRNYIEEHGPSSALAISDGTGVSSLKIKQFLRQGRIEIPEGSDSYIKCENCGSTDIKFGRFCPACARELARELEEALKPEDIGEEPKKVNGKMHFLDTASKSKK